eukprot:gene22998-30186_t
MNAIEWHRGAMFSFIFSPPVAPWRYNSEQLKASSSTKAQAHGHAPKVNVGSRRVVSVVGFTGRQYERELTRPVTSRSEAGVSVRGIDKYISSKMTLIQDPTCPVVKNILLLDSEGRRIAVKYYSKDWPTVSTQSSFEKSLWNKTSRANARQEAEIVLFDDNIAVYKYVGDLMFYVTGSQDDNELILYAVLQAFFESVSVLLRQQVEKKTVLENLDLILLAIDEIIDGGVILETDPALVSARVTMRGSEGEGASAPLTGQTFSSAFASAKEHLARSLLK